MHRWVPLRAPAWTCRLLRSLPRSLPERPQRPVGRDSCRGPPRVDAGRPAQASSRACKKADSQAARPAHGGPAPWPASLGGSDVDARSSWAGRHASSVLFTGARAGSLRTRLSAQPPQPLRVQIPALPLSSCAASAAARPPSVLSAGPGSLVGRDGVHPAPCLLVPAGAPTGHQRAGWGAGRGQGD